MQKTLLINMAEWQRALKLSCISLNLAALASSSDEERDLGETDTGV